jgi:2-deoxystreptamine N-acetyl-D-glucosaminyltransferase/2-deoxystreptamine glucosyltransferase
VPDPAPAERLEVLRLTPFFHHEGVDRWPARYDPVGGMQIQILQMSRWLARRGVGQLVLTVGFPGLPPETEIEPGLRVRPTRMAWAEIESESTGIVGLVASWFLAALRECRRLRRRGYRPDLIHVHADGQPHALWMVSLAGRLFRAPVALTVHCSRLAGYRPVSSFDALLHRWVVRSEKRALRRADAVFTLTPRTAELLRPHVGGAGDRCRVVPDTIVTRRLGAGVPDDAVRAFRRRHGIGADEELVAFVGRIAPEKGWPALLELAPGVRARGGRILVLGDGPQRGRLEREIRSAGLADAFLITGFVPHAEVAAALRIVRAVVMPSRHEELGGVALEAMASGAPVVAYAVGGLVTTVGHACPEMLVPPGDTGALNRLLLEVLEHPDRFRDAAARARTWVLETYDVDGVLGGMLDAYRRLAAGSSRARPHLAPTSATPPAPSRGRTGGEPIDRGA